MKKISERRETMADKPDFSLPGKKKESKTITPRTVITLLIILLILSGFTIITLFLKKPAGLSSLEQTGLSSEKQKELALKLEQRTLNTEAAGAWKEYLRSPGLNDSARAKIYYRLGKLYSQAGEWEKAIASFYRSESIYRDPELAAEINRLVQENFENLGKFSALSYELKERTAASGSPQPPGEEVIAEIGMEKITKSQLADMIEREVEMQLQQFAAYLPPEERNKQKEALLARYKSPEARMNELNRFLSEEMLYRWAKEKGLDRKKETRDFLQRVEKNILAGKALESAMKEQVRVGDKDLITYYEANKEKYLVPERARISQILVKDEEAARAVLEKLKEGEKFEDLAGSLSGDKDSKEKKGEIEGWVEKGKYIPGIGYDPEIFGVIFSTPAGETADKYVKSKSGYHIIKVREREPARQKEFSEVRDDILRELKSKKAEEVQQKLFQDLREKYGVVIHRDRFYNKETSPSREEKSNTEGKMSNREEKKHKGNVPDKNVPDEKE